jgi:FKBP-type peptidyl-prolyl cis-trans isomerase
MVIVALGFTACDTASDPAEKKVGDTAPERATDATKTTSTTNATKPTAPKMTKTASGLEFAILKEGEGSPPPLGSKVKVDWKGWLPDGKPVSGKTPQEYRLDSSALISGWVEALSTMKKGERRVLRVPGHLGYKEGYGDRVPRNTNLKFELELLSFTAPK